MIKLIMTAVIMFGPLGTAMAQDRIHISSDWGEVTARISDTDAGASLLEKLPLTIEMWSSNHFVIYYRDGRVPQPGIRVIGQIEGDVSIFDRPGSVTIDLSRVD